MRPTRHSTPRRIAVLAVPVLTALSLALAGCADQAGTGSGSGAQDAADTPGAAAPAPDPTELIGVWTVAEAGAADGQVARLAPDGLTVWQDSCALDGGWRADHNGLLVADVYGSSGCPAAEPVAPEWLREAARYEIQGDDAVLLDSSGGQVARLVPGGKPPAGAGTETAPPTVTAEVRKELAPAEPVPAGLTAAARADLTGRWEPVKGGGRGANPAHIEFFATGDWRGSDGCNGQAGRWVAGDAGALLATTGFSTLIGCDNVPVGMWLNEARRAAFDGAVLVLLDVQGKELGRLKPAAG